MQSGSRITRRIPSFFIPGVEIDSVGLLTSTAPVGSWRNLDEEVVNGARPDGPSGAFDGSNYLETTRDPGNEGPYGIFSEAQSTSGDQIHLEWYMYNTTGDDALLLSEPGHDQNLGQLRIGGGGVQFLNTALAFVNTTATYTPGQWNKWEIDYTVGTNQFSIQINDASNGVAETYGAGGPIDGIIFAHSGSGTYWVDGVVPEPVRGDFNNDAVADAADIDLLCDAIAAGGPLSPFDVNDDGSVNDADLTFQVEEILNTIFGDTDTDGDVDLNDLGNLASGFQVPGEKRWSRGNFDCDNDVDLPDLGTLATNFDGGVARAFAEFEGVVPEPWALSFLGLSALGFYRRSRLV
jgi:hypothetical protein